MVYAHDLKSCGRKALSVRVRPRAPTFFLLHWGRVIKITIIKIRSWQFAASKKMFLKLKRFFNNEILGIIFLFIAWRLALFLVAYFAFFNLPSYPRTVFYNDLHPILSMWLPFDSGWYTAIADFGYKLNSQAPAFFPFWPIVIEGFKRIFSFCDTRVLGFILANLLTLSDCILLYKLARFDLDDKSSFRSVKYLLFFPMSFFLATGYSEPLFLFVVLLSFYFFRLQKPLWASFSAIAASATRLIGIILIVPLFVEGLNLKNTKLKIQGIMIAFLAPLGIIVYSLYLGGLLNNRFAFLGAQTGWHRGINLQGFQELFNQIKTIFSFHLFLPEGAFITALMGGGFFMLFILAIAMSFKKIRISYILYALLVLLAPLFSGTMLSYSRMALVAFPFYIILAKWGKTKWVDDLITIVFLTMLGLFTIMFTRGWWVA